jgi:hypothetical protein
VECLICRSSYKFTRELFWEIRSDGEAFAVRLAERQEAALR